MKKINRFLINVRKMTSCVLSAKTVSAPPLCTDIAGSSGIVFNFHAKLADMYHDRIAAGMVKGLIPYGFIQVADGKDFSAVLYENL